MLKQLLLPVLMIPALAKSQPQDTVWTFMHGDNEFQSCYGFARGPDRDFWMTGVWFDQGTQTHDWYIVRLDSAHVLDSAWQIETAGTGPAMGCLPLDSNETVIFGSDNNYTRAQIRSWNDRGEELWRQEFDGQGYTNFHDGVVATDGRLVFLGVQTPADSFDQRGQIWLLKTDRLGQTIWSRTYGGANADNAGGFIESSDGGFLIGATEGELILPSVPYRGHIIKTDASGIPLWELYLGFENSIDEYLYAVAEVNNEFWCAGQTLTAEHPYGAGWLIRVSAIGELIDAQLLVPPDNIYNSSSIHDIIIQDNGEIVLVGELHIWDPSFYPGWLIALDRNANILWDRYYGDGVRLTNATLADSGGLYVAGQNFFGGESNFWLMETRPGDPQTAQPATFLLPTFDLHQNYPNPFNSTTEIRYELPTAGPASVAVYDLAGRFVASLQDGWQNAGSYRVKFDGANVASGTYFYRLEHPGAVLTQKMLFIK